MAAITVISFNGLAAAQTRDTAAMFGAVTDSQGALIPGATVTLISASTQQVRSTKTSDSGGYLSSLLPVGAYSVSVEQAGFKRYERKGIGAGRPKCQCERIARGRGCAIERRCRCPSVPGGDAFGDARAVSSNCRSTAGMPWTYRCSRPESL